MAGAVPHPGNRGRGSIWLVIAMRCQPHPATLGMLSELLAQGVESPSYIVLKIMQSKIMRLGISLLLSMQEGKNERQWCA